MLGQALVWLQQSLAALTLLVTAEARQAQLFQSWEKAKADTRSLVVEFTEEHTNLVRDEKVRYEGTFKLLRTEKGEILASYTLALAEKPGAPPKPQWVGLLNGGSLYSLDLDKKSAIRVDPADGDVPRWLEEHFNPFALLLDEKHARANYRLEVVKLDQWYTYLEFKPRKSKASRWGWGNYFERGRAVFMNKNTNGFPHDMPRQLWFNDSTCSTLIEIRSWKANAKDAPKVEEFTKPEVRPGWDVHELEGILRWLKPGKSQTDRPTRVGYIYIIGNDTTSHSAFTDRLGLYAGQELTQANLRAAERRLMPLILLGVQCSVTALDRDGDEEYKDVMVRAKESPVTRVAGPIYNAASKRLGILRESLGRQRVQGCRSQETGTDLNALRSRKE
jgi:hypothetical protein